MSAVWSVRVGCVECACRLCGVGRRCWTGSDSILVEGTVEHSIWRLAAPQLEVAEKGGKHMGRRECVPRGIGLVTEHVIGSPSPGSLESIETEHDKAGAVVRRWPNRIESFLITKNNLVMFVHASGVCMCDVMCTNVNVSVCVAHTPIRVCVCVRVCMGDLM